MTLDYPDGKKFAFTVFDDTDVATVENVKPIYDLLHRLGMRTTKTAWVLPCPGPEVDFVSSQTLADPAYLAFVQDLQRRGFEIAWHGATMESSLREQTLRGTGAIQSLVRWLSRARMPIMPIIGKTSTGERDESIILCLSCFSE